MTHTVAKLKVLVAHIQALLQKKESAKIGAF